MLIHGTIRRTKCSFSLRAQKVTAFSVFGLNKYLRQNKDTTNGYGLTDKLAAYRQ